MALWIMHILLCEYFALIHDDTLSTFKSIRLSSFCSPRLVRINRLTELNQNNTTPADVNTSAHFSEVAHDIVQSPTLYSDVPLSQEQPSYDDFPSHKVLMDTITWTSASTGNTLISTDLMNTFITNAGTDAVSKKLANFHYFTADIKFTVVVQGFSNNYGKMIIWFDPAPFNTVPGTLIANVPPAGSMMALPQKVRSEHIPHIEVDPSKDATYEITLKCPTALGCYSRLLRTGSYRYGYIIFNPMNNGIGVTVPNVTITTYMSLENVKLSVLTFTSSDSAVIDFVNIPEPAGFVYRTDNVVYTSSFTAKEQSMKPSNIASSMSSGLQMLSSIPVIGKYATLGSSIAGGAAKVLEWFGFSKPVVEKKNGMMLGYTCDEITVLDGEVHAHTVGARISNSITVDSSVIPFCNPMDQDMEFLANKLFLVRQVTVLPASGAGAALANFDLAPNTLFTSDSPVSVNTYEPTTLYYLTRFYDQYKCDFLIEIEVVSSPLHRASLVVAYFPNVADDSVAVTMALAQQTLKTTTIQVSGNSKTLLKIPYSQPQNYLATASGVNTAYSTYGFSNGRIGIYLLNPVVSNGTGPIYLNIRMGACNLSMGVPTIGLLANHSVVFTSSTPVAVSDPMCIPEPTFYQKYFGEDMAHTTKELAGRGTISATWKDAAFTVGSKCVHAVYPVNPVASDSVGGTYVRAQNFFDWLAIMYVGYKGSTNVTWYPNISGSAIVGQLRGGLETGGVPATTLYVDPIDMFNSSFSAVRYAFYTGFGQNQNYLTTKVPYYFKGHFKPTFPSRITATAYSHCATLDIQNRNDSVAGAPFRLAIATALGDDGQFVGFRGIPLLTIV